MCKQALGQADAASAALASSLPALHPIHHVDPALAAQSLSLLPPGTAAAAGVYIPQFSGPTASTSRDVMLQQYLDSFGKCTFHCLKLRVLGQRACLSDSSVTA